MNASGECDDDDDDDDEKGDVMCDGGNMKDHAPRTPPNRKGSIGMCPEASLVADNDRREAGVPKQEGVQVAGHGGDKGEGRIWRRKGRNGAHGATATADRDQKRREGPHSDEGVPRKRAATVSDRHFVVEK